jgi:hypothetical protein
MQKNTQVFCRFAVFTVKVVIYIKSIHSGAHANFLQLMQGIKIKLI